MVPSSEQTALLACRSRKAFCSPMDIGAKRHTGHVMTDKRTRGPDEGTFYFYFKYDNIRYMDPELKQLLEENIKLSKENNEMLTGIVRTNKRKKIIQYIYWGLIILVTFGSLFFIQPLIGSLTSLYTGGASNLLN